MIYLFYQIPNEHICIIKFLLELYENLMTISTIENDVEKAKVQITVAPDFLDDCLDVLADMEKRFPIIRLEEDSTVSQGNY